MWRRAQAGERRLALVAGEPGIGKTRLAAELAARAIDEGATVLHGWCDEDYGTPYQPWAFAFGAFVRGRADDEIRSLVHGIAPDLARLLPEIARRVPGIDPGPVVEHETERARLFEAIDTFIERVCSSRPLIVVLDDLHWADAPTLAVLRRLLRSDRPDQVLFLGTYRDTDVHRRHPLGDLLADLRRDPRVGRVALRGLDEAGVGAMLADRAGHEAAAEFVRVLHRGTDGNPFFAEEVVSHLVETGVIYEREGEWTSDLAADDLGLPEGVRDVVGRRLSRLSDAANEILVVAAVVGREFELSTVVAAGTADRDAVLDAIDAALETGLVNEVRGSAGRFAFSHALVRQTLVEELRGAGKARLHWRVGEALATRSDAASAVVAFHLCEGVLAGDTLRAVDAAVVAAEEAAALAAADEARSFANRALEMLSDSAVDAPEQRCRALLLIGETAVTRGRDIAESRPALIEAAELARRHAWPDVAARAAVTYTFLAQPGTVDPVQRELAVAGIDLGVSATWRPPLLAIAGRYLLVEDWDAGTALLDEAIAGLASCELLGRIIVLSAWLNAHMGAAELDACSGPAEESLVLAESIADSYWIVGARLQRAALAIRAGDRSGFEQELEQLAVAAPTAGGGGSDVPVLQGMCALLDGRFADAEQLALGVLSTIDPETANYQNSSAQIAAIWYLTGRDDELLAALDVFPVEQWPQRTLVDLVRSSTRARRGERDAAFDALAADNFRALPKDWFGPGALAYAAFTASWLGDERSAAVLEPLLAPYSGQLIILPAASVPFAGADSVRGMLLATLGRHDDAIACYEAAVGLYERLRDAPHAVMNTHLLARSLVARNHDGDRARARPLAEAALRRATELDLRPDARFAQEVLASL